jgi:hypothetical protein
VATRVSAWRRTAEQTPYTACFVSFRLSRSRSSECVPAPYAAT